MKPFSTINHDAIRNHQTNNSPTKVAFKFSQSKRFKDPNPEYLLSYSDVHALSIKSIKTYLNFLNVKLPLDMETNLISPRPSRVVHPRLPITSSPVFRKPN
jgi:hypothetical protein